MRPLFIVLLIILFILSLCSYSLLDNINIYITVKRPTQIQVPNNITKEVEIREPRSMQNCTNVSYRYELIGGTVLPKGLNVQPTTELTNLEDRWGLFKLNFSFVDSNKFPYDEYGGDNLAQKYANGEITHKDADFSSVNYEFLVGPFERIIITNQTMRKDQSKNYWAMIFVDEPKYESCRVITTYDSRIVNKTFTEYVNKNSFVRVKEYKRLNEVFQIDSFGEWFVIVSMFVLIIVLIILILQRFRYNRRIK